MASPSMQLNGKASHRTNSLGVAKRDCHTCAAMKRHCDRQRPKCVSRRVGNSNILDLGQRPSRQPQDFKFVQARAKRKYKPRRRNTFRANQSIMNHTQSPSLRRHMESPMVMYSPAPVDNEMLEGLSTPHTLNNNDFGTFQSVPETLHDVLHASFDAILPSFWTNITEQAELIPEASMMLPSLEHADSFPNGIAGNSHSIANTSVVVQSTLNSDISDSLTKSYVEQDVIYLPTPLHEVISYSNLAHKYSAVLDMYNGEFCIVPLTSDCRTNPFRVRTGDANGSSFLLHAIIALSSQYLAKKRSCSFMAAEMQNHRSMALQLFSQALCYEDRSHLLDTLLILISLDISQAVAGMWGVHLNGARKLLETAESAERVQSSSRVRSQVAMLVWLDVTVALISRKEPRLPMTYLETLMRFDEGDDWSFVTLNGCSAELVMAMARLAKLASIYEKTAQMEWTIFNMLPVVAVIEEVKDVVNEDDVTFADIDHLKENANAQRDRFHCIEAWRNAIILYACRVFTPKQNACQLCRIDHLSRVILDHARCIRRSEFIQKQVLLPVFLAGSEVGDEGNRSFIREYCKHWSLTSRYYHFESTAALLEDIWSDWNVLNRDAYWWGVKVGCSESTDSDSSEQSMITELLLG